MQIIDFLSFEVLSGIAVLLGGTAGLVASIAGLWAVRLRAIDQKDRRVRRDAEFVRSNLMTWSQESDLGRVTLWVGEIHRYEAEDPPHFQEAHGRQLLNRYCPGLWKAWVDLKAKRSAKNDELGKLYERFLSQVQTIHSQFLGGIEWIKFDKLSDYIYEEAMNRLKNTGRDFTVDRPQTEAIFRLRYEGYNDDIARGEKALLLELKRQILEILSGSELLELTSFKTQFDTEIHVEDSDFYREKERAIRKLESTYSLERKTNFGGI